MVALRRLDSLDSLWEMERYLVHHGYRSSYSIQDLEAELDVLDP